MARCSFALFLALSLMANAFCVPASLYRQRRGLTDNQLDSKESLTTTPAASTNSSKDQSENHSSDDSKTSSTTTVAIDEDKSYVDDDDDFGNKQQDSPPSTGGSNIYSLFNFASALFPASGSGSSNTKNNNLIVKQLIQDLIRINRSQIRVIQKRQDIADNVIDIDYATDLKPPPFQKLELDETDDGESTESSSEEDDDNGAEESVEKESNENSSKSKQDSNAPEGNSDADDDNNDSDYDEPEGDGQGGGILGLLAGLSGDGESDLGTLLATIGGIVASLSGDGVDINAIIATGLGLLVGLLSEGNQNPGEIIASYLLTSLDTISGGGAKNNGAFFGKFISKLVKGTSAGGDPDAESASGSEENGMTMADSAGFFVSLLMGLLGEMSKTSSGGSWR